jgi:Lhr-like helicase
VAYLDEQREATGVVPSDRTIVVERFRDEIGDWRVVVHSPFGGRVHAPWALAIEARARERLGLEVQTMYADDGIVVRVPEADEAPPAETVLVDADDVEDLVVTELSGSALFASRFRECAARALLLPRRRPGSRTPLWQQRQKAADLLQVAGRYGSFPVLLETYREVLRDVFDLPALQSLLGAIADAAGPRRPGRDTRRLAVRVLAAVRLRRRLHVRGRRAAGGAARVGAHARPRAARRAAGLRRAARAHRSRRPGRPRARAPAARRRPAGARRR